MLLKWAHSLSHNLTTIRLSAGQALALFLPFNIILYWPVITARETVNIDHTSVLTPLYALDSFFAYFPALGRGEILDLQPFRDILLLLQIRLNEILGISTFVLVNVLIWTFCLTIFYRLLKKISSGQDIIILAFLLVFSCHPAFTVTIAHIIAQKHLWALFFTLLSTIFFLAENERPWNKVFICLSFLLAVMSHPMALCWPVWAIFYQLWNRPKVDRPLMVALVLTMVVWGGLVYAYHAFIMAKLHIRSMGDPYNWGDKALALGRHFFQIICPFFIASTYAKGSWQNMAGLLLLGPFFYFFFKRLGGRQLLLWSTFFFIPLGIVSLNTGQESGFVSDRYVLFPALGFFTMLFLSLRVYLEKYLKTAGAAFFLMLTIFFYTARNEIVRWANVYSYFQHSYQVEKTCTNAIRHAYLYLIWENQMVEAPLKSFLVENHCLEIKNDDAPTILKVLVLLTYYDPEISAEKKKTGLQKFSQLDPFSTFVWAAYMAKSGEEKKALAIAKEIFEGPATEQYPLQIPLAQEFLPLCQKHRLLKCQYALEVSIKK
jgi:hypothetical protein